LAPSIGTFGCLLARIRYRRANGPMPKGVFVGPFFIGLLLTAAAASASFSMGRPGGLGVVGLLLPGLIAYGALALIVLISQSRDACERTIQILCLLATWPKGLSRDDVLRYMQVGTSSHFRLGEFARTPRRPEVEGWHAKIASGAFAAY